MKHALIWPDEFGAVDKPKRVRCLEDELAPLNIDPVIKAHRTEAPCKVCGKRTKNYTRECSRMTCMAARGDA